MLQLQQRSNSLEWLSTRQQSCLIKFHTISWHVWCPGISLVSFLFWYQWTWMYVWLNGSKAWGFTKQQPNIATGSSHQTSLPSHVFNYGVMNKHTCLLMRHRDSSDLWRLHLTTNNVCCNCTWLTGMLGTVALEQQACLFKLRPPSVHVCSTCTRPSVQSSLPKGQQTYLTLRMFDYVAQDLHTCLKPSGNFL